jgi:hypothetical protein
MSLILITFEAAASVAALVIVCETKRYKVATPFQQGSYRYASMGRRVSDSK